MGAFSQYAALLSQGGDQGPPDTSQALAVPQQVPNQSQVPTSPTAPPPVRKGGLIKQYLSNFLYGMGESMKHEVGLPTDREVQAQNLQNQLRIAQTQNEQAEAALKQSQSQMVTVPGYGPMPSGLAKALFPALVGAQSKTDVANINAQSREKVAGINAGIPVPVPDNVASQFGLKPGTMIGDKALKRLQGTATQNLQKSSRMIDGVPHIVYQDKLSGDVIHDLGPDPTLAINAAKAKAFADSRASVTPFTTFDEDGNLVTTSAGQAIAKGVPSAQVWNQLYGATGSTKSQGQAAEAVAEHIPSFQDSVQKLAAKGQLGPVMGRINDYLTKGYGGSDPDIAEFVTTVGLLKSGAVRAHFGARGGAQILSKFDGLLNTAQTPEAMIGSSNAIKDFLQGYGRAGSNTNTPRTSVPTPGTAPRATGGEQTVNPGGIRIKRDANGRIVGVD